MKNQAWIEIRFNKLYLLLGVDGVMVIIQLWICIYNLPETQLFASVQSIGPNIERIDIGIKILNISIKNKEIYVHKIKLRLKL